MSSHFTVMQERLLIAHGAMGSAAWGFIFPVGAILVRIVPSRMAWLLHGLLMMLGLLVFTAAVAIGLWQTLDHGYTVSAPHTVMGVTVFSLAWTQPISGLLHHYILHRYDVKTISSTLHVFLGRLLILSGMVDGGLGLLLKGDSTGTQNIAYGTVVGIIYIAYLLTSLWYEARNQNDGRKALGTEKKFIPYEEGNLQGKSSEVETLYHSGSGSPR